MDSNLLRKLLYPVLISVVLGCLGGCEGRNSAAARLSEEEKIKPSEKLVPDPDRRLADVPVPLGAHFKAGSSRSYQTGSRRRVDHHYGIWAKKARLRKFYRDNMPLHGWELTNTIAGGGTYCMIYKKGRESCRVSIGPTTWCLQTCIEITVQPVGDFD